MATWIIHLRITDDLLREFSSHIPSFSLSKTEFTIGSIAPDSGVPNDDGTYTPSKKISHYFVPIERGFNVCDYGRFADEYLPGDKLASYSAGQLSFYLGYLTHLITDYAWLNYVHTRLYLRDEDAYLRDRRSAIEKWKRDWYDTDFLYLREHPSFPAYRIYREAVGFSNTYLPFFSEDAFALRQTGIVEFYEAPHEGLDRDYPYLSPADADAFVAETLPRVRFECRRLLPALFL